MSCLPDGSHKRFKSLPTSVSRRRAVNLKAECVRWPYPATRGICDGTSLAFLEEVVLRIDGVG